MVLGVAINILRARILDHQITAALSKFFHPTGKLQTLVYRLSVAVELCLPEQSLGFVRPGNSEGDALGDRTLLFPEVDAQVPFILQRIVKHELAGSDPAAQYLLRGPIGNNRDFVVLL